PPGSSAWKARGNHHKSRKDCRRHRAIRTVADSGGRKENECGLLKSSKRISAGRTSRWPRSRKSMLARKNGMKDETKASIIDAIRDHPQIVGAALTGSFARPGGS